MCHPPPMSRADRRRTYGISDGVSGFEGGCGRLMSVGCGAVDDCCAIVTKFVSSFRRTGRGVDGDARRSIDDGSCRVRPLGGSRERIQPGISGMVSFVTTMVW